MKKTILLSAITFISIMAATSVNAQYYKGSFAYNRNNNAGSYRRYDDHIYRQNTIAYHDVRHEGYDAYYWEQKIGNLKIAVMEDQRCGNWGAYDMHKAELDQAYRDQSHDLSYSGYAYDRR